MRRIRLIVVWSAVFAAIPNGPPHTQAGEVSPPLKTLPVPALLPLQQIDYKWTVQDMDRVTHPLFDAQGKVIFMNIWDTACKPCRAEMGNLSALYKELKSEKIFFMIVSPEKPEHVISWVKEHPYDLPFYTFHGGLPPPFWIKGVPTTYIIQRNGRIVGRIEGAARWDDPAVANYLRELAQESF